ncbi:helix-turn-helix domain-containing protein [Methylobacterium durans]|uniref:AraC-like ligand-binding domain-containing protein n=1 Tax=Methylobacterium durans TaxID=2202825 RepID=UPI002AFE6CB0|nr:helix-turn-helix domain-containing protein [Methylobacterium durans]MEA1835127.1 helix-turn-helix domain-containing protein [Methylobacterium durans]
MRTVFTTDRLHERDRFAHWHHIARQGIVDHDAKPVCRKSFRAELHVGAIGTNGLAFFKSSDMTVSRTRQHIARGATDEIFVCRQFSGRLVLEQDGHQVGLERGDVTLLDPAVPYAARFSGGSELLVVKVRRNALEGRVGRARELTARALPANADGRLTSAYLGLLPFHADGLSAAVGVSVEPHLLDLIALSFSRVSGRTAAQGSSARSLVRTRLRAAVEANLCDRSFGVAAAAQAAGVSVRYANAVLTDEGTSIMQLLQTRRLERCRQALADPAQAHRKVSEIAYGWGFSDMSHFGRRFRALFGMLPSEFRRGTQMASTRDLEG